MGEINKTSSSPIRVATTTSPRSPQHQSTAKHRYEERQCQRRQALLGSLKKCCLYILTGTAIASSIVSIYSCAFFSYQDASTENYNFDPVDDDFEFQNNSIKSGIIDQNTIDHNESLSYDPFKDMPEASVGLFSYSVYFSSKCFRYYDEATDYSMFESNRNDTIDLWLLARFCSMLAPSVAFLAFALLLVEWAFGCRIARYSSVLTFLLFLMAGVLQCGTFVLLLAPSTLSFDDAKSFNGETQQAFCLGSTIRCRLDSGAWCSMGSAIAYMVLALTSTTPKGHNDASDNNHGESIDEECCRGCCFVERKPFRLPQRDDDIDRDDHRKKKKQLWVKEMGGDTSSGSSFSIGNSKSSSNCSCCGHEAGNCENKNHRGETQVENSVHDIEENFREQAQIDLMESNNHRILADLAGERHVGTPNPSRHRTVDFQHDDNDSFIDDEEHSIIIRKVKATIGTEHIRTGVACCYCAETDLETEETSTETATADNNNDIETNNNDTTTAGGNKKVLSPKNIRSWQTMVSILSDDKNCSLNNSTDSEDNKSKVSRKSVRSWTMASMLSEDTEVLESDDEEVGACAVANPPPSHSESSSTVAECEAILMAELEGAQMEDGGNWENSKWKSGFDFVRS